MPETDLVGELRSRATSLVHENQPAVAALLQALPNLLIVGQQYQSAKRAYADFHLRQRDIYALQRIEEYARKRLRLMQDRYHTAERSIDAIEDTRFIYGAIAATNVAIAAGKTAELFLAAGKWAKIAKWVVDDLKEFVDYAKAGTAVMDSAIKNDDGAAALSIVQLAAVQMRLDTNYERLIKLLWDGSGAARRFYSMKDFAQTLSSCVNLLKILLDALVSLVDWLKTKSKGVNYYASRFKDLSPMVGIVRDAIDALRALYGAGQSLAAAWRTLETQERAEREAAGYLGHGDVVLLDPDKAFAELHPAAIVSEARSVDGARSLIQAVRDTARRIESDIVALDALFWRDLLRLRSAFRDLEPHLTAAKQALSRCRVQITNLDIVIGRSGPRAEAAKPIRAALEGYRDYLASLCSQIDGIVVEDIPVQQVPAPLPRFDLYDESVV